MKLIISAVEDVVVDTFSDGKYNEYMAQKIKAEDILGVIQSRIDGNFDKVEEILLNVGPGSFTGIRASMALVLGLTASKKINIIPFTTFDAMEYSKLTAKQILAVNGFSNFVYISYLDGDKRVNDSIEIEKLIKFAIKNKMTILTYSDNILEEVISGGANAQKIKFSVKFALERYMNNTLEKRTLEPVYLRLSQAEIQRKEKNSSGKAKRSN